MPVSTGKERESFGSTNPMEYSDSPGPGCRHCRGWAGRIGPDYADGAEQSYGISFYFGRVQCGGIRSLSIIAFAGGFLSTGNNVNNFSVGANPFATSLMAFLFSTASILLILGLCTVRSFSPNVVVLSGVAIGSLWTAATTILQFYATDVGIAAAVVWNFGDLGRATYRTDWIMLAVVTVGVLFFLLVSWQLNALLSGEATAKTMGVPVELLRFVCLLLASIMTAVCVSFLGVIGFVGIICPHTVKKLLGQDHRVTVPASALAGSLLLLLADTVSRSMGSGSALPVGAITSMLGAPFFLAIIFSEKGKSKC